MSVVDQLKNMFASRAPDPDQDTRLSLGMPDATMDSMVTEQMLGDTRIGVSQPARRSARTGSVRVAGERSDTDATELIELPFLGKKSVHQHQRLLLILMGAALVLLALVAILTRNQANTVAQQLAVTGHSLMQSQRLAKSVPQALQGQVQAFADVAESANVMAQAARGLSAGDEQSGLKALSADYQPEFEKIMPLLERTEKNAAIVMSQQKVLTQAAGALGLLNQRASELLEISEAVAARKLQQNAPAPEIAAAGRLVMLTQQIDKLFNEFRTVAGVSPAAVLLLGKDMNLFQQTAQGLLYGSSELNLTPARDAPTREQLAALLQRFEATRLQASAILDPLADLVSARDAHLAIVADSEPLRQNLQTLQDKLSSYVSLGAGALLTLLGAALLALLCAVGLSYVQLRDSRQRQGLAELQRSDAEGQRQEAKRVNDANQAAILRLMNELQTVAEGDLTQEATVTEDITGAIADSINYTVEELRSLVGSVQSTVARVAQTTTDVDATSTELLAASNEQLHEIRETGRSVLDMASRINEVSVQAQESAAVARQSLQAAEVGFQAVQNAIGGMNAIRDQIQDTSKRIKRLGESSQEIGEITELISDITEQTNVLALNAAIQAASAGEAGRGFSVVAEEVQRLAERSADATRQIAALVKAIQTDTQDAVGAMERSTQGVVEGAKLSDNAGTALTEIDQVSRRLAELIEQISSSTSREANLANVVADNIQHIFAVTEQTGEGTRTTAAQVRELSKMAEELSQSVARFKIA